MRLIGFRSSLGFECLNDFSHLVEFVTIVRQSGKIGLHNGVTGLSAFGSRFYVSHESLNGNVVGDRRDTHQERADYGQKASRGAHTETTPKRAQELFQRL